MMRCTSNRHVSYCDVTQILLFVTVADGPGENRLYPHLWSSSCAAAGESLQSNVQTWHLLYGQESH